MAISRQETPSKTSTFIGSRRKCYLYSRSCKQVNLITSELFPSLQVPVKTSAFIKTCASKFIEHLLTWLKCVLTLKSNQRKSRPPKINNTLYIILQSWFISRFRFLHKLLLSTHCSNYSYISRLHPPDRWCVYFTSVVI